MIIQRVIGAPISIIGSAVADVFRQQASEAYIKRGECVEEYVSALKKLLAISTIPFSIFIIIAPDLFAIVFGVDWRQAGEYAQILTPMFFLQFLVSPVSCMYTISNNQREDLRLQIFMVTVIILIFSLGFEFKTSLMLFMMFFVSIYIFVLYRTFIFAGGRR